MKKEEKKRLGEILVKVNSDKETLAVVRYAKSLGYRVPEKSIAYFLGCYAVVLSPNTVVRHCDERLYSNLSECYREMKVVDFMGYTGEGL